MALYAHFPNRRGAKTHAAALANKFVDAKNNGRPIFEVRESQDGAVQQPVIGFQSQVDPNGRPGALWGSNVTYLENRLAGTHPNKSKDFSELAVYVATAALGVLRAESRSGAQMFVDMLLSSGCPTPGINALLAFAACLHAESPELAARYVGNIQFWVGEPPPSN